MEQRKRKVYALFETSIKGALQGLRLEITFLMQTL